MRAIVLTGAGERAFAAGADIKEMAGATAESLTPATVSRPGSLRTIRKPMIAAVRGFALGGGCELAMACDLIVAGDDAQFGQPEIRIGVMPGAGGTQRLTRAIGKARAMELILTGRSIDAREAARLGLVTRVVPAEATLESALDLAAEIATMPPLAVAAAKRRSTRPTRCRSRRSRRRAPGVLRPVRHSRPDGGHGGVRREAAAALDRPLMSEPARSPLRYAVADAVATLTLDRPEARNALDAALKRELLGAIRAAGRDRAVRALVLTGAGSAFSAGQDLREASVPDAPPLSTVLRQTYNPLILAMRRLDKPIVAAVNGVAAGAGLALALACDLRIAADTATFVLAFGRIGLVPDSGTTWFLPRPRRPGAGRRARAGRRSPDGSRRRAMGPRQPRRPGGCRAGRGPGPRRAPGGRCAARARADQAGPEPVARRDARRTARRRGGAAGGRRPIGGPPRGRRRLPGEAAAAVHRGVAGITVPSAR